jgi:hypothetical protein
MVNVGGMSFTTFTGVVPVSDLDPYTDAVLDPWLGYRQLREAGPAVAVPTTYAGSEVSPVGLERSGMNDHWCRSSGAASGRPVFALGHTGCIVQGERPNPDGHSFPGPGSDGTMKTIRLPIQRSIGNGDDRHRTPRLRTRTRFRLQSLRRRHP